MDEAELKARMNECESRARQKIGLQLREPVRQAAAWRCFAELVRRHPQLWVLEMHAGGGQYDEVVVWDPSTHQTPVRFNYVGSLHLDPFGERYQTLDWVDLLRGEPRQFLTRIEDVTGLRSPSAVPCSTPRVLTYRAIAHLAGATAFNRNDVSLANGFYDSSGYAQGPREASFAEFPSIADDRRLSSADAPNGIAEYRFWFVYESQGPGEASRPLVAFETTGHAWKPGEDAGERFDFVRTYDAVGRNFDRLMAAFDTWRAQG